MVKLWLFSGALYAGIAVVLGAFGAHALRSRLSENLLRAWQTGVEYEFYHGLALIAVGIIAHLGLASAPWLNAAGGLFFFGVLLFCGSLYGLALTEFRLLGPVTPLGGLLFILGWLCLLVAIVRG